MMFKTHLAFGFLLAIFSLNYIPAESQFIFAFIVLAASALPDVDHPNSKLGSKVKPIAWLFDHRGFFHSLFAIAIFTGVFYLITGSVIYSIAFLIGYASHIMLDSLSVAGIQPFAPLLRFRLKGIFHCNAAYDYAFFMVISIIAVIKIGARIF